MHAKEILDCLAAGCGQAHCDELKGHSVEQALHLLKQPDYSGYIPTDGRYPPVPTDQDVGSTIMNDMFGRVASAQGKAAQAEAQLKAKAARVVQGAVQYQYQAPDRATVLANLAAMNNKVSNLEHALTALQASLSLKPDQASQDLHQQLSGMKQTARQQAADVTKAVNHDAAFHETVLSAKHAAAKAQAAGAKAAGAVDQSFWDIFSPHSGSYAGGA